MSVLDLGREQILGFRRRVGGLDARAGHTPASLREAAWAGLQDSMPRAAVLSLHARVEGVRPESWDDPAFVQIWGPALPGLRDPRGGPRRLLARAPAG